MRFGLVDGQSRTLEEIGHAFSVTRERVRQIEARALHKLRQPYRNYKLRDHVGSQGETVITEISVPVQSPEIELPLKQNRDILVQIEIPKFTFGPMNATVAA